MRRLLIQLMCGGASCAAGLLIAAASAGCAHTGRGSQPGADVLEHHAWVLFRRAERPFMRQSYAEAKGALSRLTREGAGDWLSAAQRDRVAEMKRVIARKLPPPVPMRPEEGPPVERPKPASEPARPPLPPNVVRMREELDAALKAANPDYTGEGGLVIRNGRLIVSINSCRVRDLAPLRGLALQKLYCRDNPIFDLSPLEGMPLEDLRCGDTLVSDLAPLRGCPLASLGCSGTAVSDLSPLRGMPLRWLDCSFTRVTDLSPLAGMRLRSLNVQEQAIRDFSPLLRVPLDSLSFSRDRARGDIFVLRGHKTLKFIDDGETNLGVDMYWLVQDARAGRLRLPDPAAEQRLDEAWRQRIKDNLAKRVRLDFYQAPLSDVAPFLSSLVEITIVLDPQAVRDGGPKLTEKRTNVPLREALDWACKAAGMVWVERDGAVLVTTPERAKGPLGRLDEFRAHQWPSDRQELAFWMSVMWRPAISFDFVEAPLRDVTQFLGSVYDLTFVVDPQAQSGELPAVTLRLQGMRLDQALRWLCRLTGLVYIWVDGALLVATPDRARQVCREGDALVEAPPKKLAGKLAEPVYFDFVEKPLNDVADWLSENTGLAVAVDVAPRKAEEVRVVLRVCNLRLDRALRWLCRVTHLACVWREGRLVFTTPEWAREEAKKR